MPSCEVYRAPALACLGIFGMMLATADTKAGKHRSSNLGAAGQLQVQAAASRCAKDERGGRRKTHVLLLSHRKTIPWNLRRITGGGVFDHVPKTNPWLWGSMRS